MPKKIAIPLKEQIQLEMMTYRIDDLIAEISKETRFSYREIKPYAEKIVKELCDICRNGTTKPPCFHKYRPRLVEDLSEFDCFEKPK